MRICNSLIFWVDGEHGVLSLRERAENARAPAGMSFNR